MRRRTGKVNGTPTGEPQPQSIDDWSGFKVPLGDLKKEWTGMYSVHPDTRNPQDYVRGVRDDQSLPFARPETPDSFVALPILLENGAFMFTEDGNIILTQGLDPFDTL
jgi:hypothetical protein